MIITKDDVGRKVKTKFGDIETITDFDETRMFPVETDGHLGYKADGLYEDCYYYGDDGESDIVSFVETIKYNNDEPEVRPKTMDEIVQDLVDEINPNFISFTVPENCVNITLSINGYLVYVTKPQEKNEEDWSF